MEKEPITYMIKRAVNHCAHLLHIKRRIFVFRENEEGDDSTISYAITVCNEAERLRSLLEFLIPYCRPGDEIVVLADSMNVTEEVRKIIRAYDSALTAHAEHALNHDFAQAKNYLNTLCHGEWIFQLDADECPQTWLMEHIHTILRANSDAELIKLPRINRFINTGKDVIESHVAWPDYQGRLYRNIPHRIKWHRAIHERIQGYKVYTYLPKKERYAILHTKEKEQDRRKWLVWKETYK
jgi:hypothetical protein